MHYKNGREAKVGDFAVGKNINGEPIAAMIVSITPGADKCNANVIPVSDIYRNRVLATLSDLIHVEDLEKHFTEIEIAMQKPVQGDKL